MSRVSSIAALQFLLDHRDTLIQECILWPYGKMGTGYGEIVYLGVRQNAHAVMCLLAHGEPTIPNSLAAHNCPKGPIRLCINPNHVSWKSPVENQQDRIRDGSSNRKLSKNDLQEIKDLLLSGPYNQSSIAHLYGCSCTTICHIKQGKNYLGVLIEKH